MTRASPPEVLALWPDTAPGEGAWPGREQVTQLPGGGPRLVRNVTHPTVTAFLPEPTKATGAAVVVCPGGGFQFYAAFDTEGTDETRWFTSHGVAAFVLKYRLIPTGNDDAFLQVIRSMFAPPSVLEAMLGKDAAAAQQAHLWAQRRAHAPLAVQDGLQALRLLRAQATIWGLDPQRIGIVGQSAGGVVALGTATEYQVDCRPAFVAAISSHGGSWPDRTPGLQGTRDRVVPSDAPPLFLAFATDDPLIPDGNMPLYAAWKAAGRPVELHSYARGGHDWTERSEDMPIKHWMDRLGDWLRGDSVLP